MGGNGNLGIETVFGIMIAVALLASMATSASALGLSYEPLENKTLKLAAGEERYFKLTLQNEEDQDVTVNVSVRSGIAALVGDPVTVLPAKTYDRFVYFNISVPADAPVGARYTIQYTVMPIVKMEGQVPFAVRYDRSFDVLVDAPQAGVTVKGPPADIDQVQRRERRTGTVLLVAFAGLLLIVLIVLLWRKSKGMSRRIDRAKYADSSTHTDRTVRSDAVHQQSAIEHPVSAPRHATQHATPGKDTPKTETDVKTEPKAETKIAARLKSTQPEHAFRAADGASFRSLQELLDGLRHMGDREFSHHVSNHKDDFSTWVADTLGEEALAQKLHATKSRQQMIKVLEDALR